MTNWSISRRDAFTTRANPPKKTEVDAKHILTTSRIGSNEAKHVKASVTNKDHLV